MSNEKPVSILSHLPTPRRAAGSACKPLLPPALLVAAAPCQAAVMTDSVWHLGLHSALGPWWGWSLFGATALLLLLLTVYAVRHYVFSLNRLFAAQRHPYASVVSADWPRVTIFIAAHNEEAVIADCLANLMAVDYPADRMVVMPVIRSMVLN